MDNQLLQEINITLGAGFQQLAASLRRLERNFGQYGQQANRAGQQTQRTNRTMQQTTRNANQAGQAVRRMGGGISNIQAGLVQLSNYLLILNQRITNTFANMTKRFTNAEDAMTQLKITLGLGGKTRMMDPKGFAEFEESTQLINNLAATTQFTKKEVANAFTELVQSGRKLQESNKLIASTLQMATASGGMIDLKEATEIATLSIGTLGAKVEEVPDVLNMLVRLSQKTRVGFTDLRSVMESLGSSFVNLGDEGVKRSTALMVMAAALRALGDQGRGAGHHVGQFFRTMTGIQTVLARGKLRFEAGLGGKGRMNLKREALVQLFGVDRISQDELVRATDGVVKIGENYTERLRDEFVKRQFLRPLGGGKYAKLESVELMRNIAKAYFRLQGEVGADAEHIITRAFGQKAGIEMLQAIIRFADQAGVKVDKAADHFANSIKVMMTNEKDLMRATEESQKTLSYRLKVLDSAYDNLSNTIYKHDLVNRDAVDTHKEIVSAVGVLMEKNEGLASSVALLGRGLQFLSGVGANVGFTLVAAATFSHGLTMSLRGTTVAAAGLSGTLRAFGTMFLVPTLTVVLQLTGALAVLSLGLLAMVRYFGGENLTTAQAFANVLERIKNAAKAAGGMMNLVFSKEYGDTGVFANLKRFYELREEMVAERKRVTDPFHIQKLRDALYESKRLLGRASDQRGREFYSKRVLEDTEKLNAALKGTSDRYDTLDRHMSKLKGTLGKSGYEGLYSFVGNEQIVLAIGQVIDAVRELASGLMIIAESALTPIMMGVAIAFRVAGYAVQIFLLPFKLLAQFFGFATDEASQLTQALKFMGMVIGVLISTVIARRSLLLITMAFRGLGTMVTTTANSFIGLGRAAIGGMSQTTRSAVVGSTIAGTRLSVLTQMVRNTRLAVASLGNGFLMLGMTLSMLGYEKTGGVITFLSLLVPALYILTPALANVQRSALGLMVTLTLIAAAVLGVLYAMGKLEGFKMPSVTGGDMGLGSPPTGAVSGAMTGAQADVAFGGIPTPYNGLQPGGYTATSGVPTFTSPERTTRTVRQVTQHNNNTNINIQKMSVQTRNATQFKTDLSKMSRTRPAVSDYSMAIGD